MDCTSARDNLGLYVDGELGTDEVEALTGHLRACPSCAAKHARLQALIANLGAIGASEPVTQPPAEMWARIEERLSPARAPRQTRLVRFWRQPLAAAASLAFMLGLGALVAVWVDRSAETAAAATVDYSLLLDGVADDVNTAVERFFRHYRAVPVAAEAVHAAVPKMSFNLPEELPGGFKREGIYRLRFGTAEGVAGRYRRGDEPLVVFFHPPMKHTQLGIHRESCCHVAGREGQRVEVGPWRLVHFTDPTTCHCLLSKLDDEAAQAAVFAAVAPNFPR